MKIIIPVQEVMQSELTEIYKEYYSRVKIYLMRFVDKDDAEDLTQEVFIKVMNSLNKFKGESKLSTWIYKIATNTAIDKLKSYNHKSRKKKILSLDYIEPLKTNPGYKENGEGI